MRRLEFLINEVRTSTDNTDTNGISTDEIIGYYNSAQRYITTLIFKNNPYADLFKSQQVYPATTPSVYTLPSNCYAANAVSMVEVRVNTSSINDGYVRIKPIMESEFGFAFGYITRDNQILISGQDNVSWFSDVRVTYFRQLPTLDIRRGTVIAAVVPNVSISLFTAPTDIEDLDDQFSTVDSTGAQLVKGVSFTYPGTGVVLTTPSNAGVITNTFLVVGADAANKSLLPDACETYLQDYVRQRIYTRNNYDDANKQMYFTEMQMNEIISLFAKNKKDDDNIPTTDIDFLLW
jgi:hypothetical protein